MKFHLTGYGPDHSGLPRLPKLTDETWTTVANQLRLTPRQAEIVFLVLQAKADKEIAAALGLGVSTVRMHLRHVFSQLDISDRMELALMVFHATCQQCYLNAP